MKPFVPETSSMLTIFTRSLRDFLNFRILLLSIVPILGAGLFWGGVFYLFAEQIDALLVGWLSRLPLVNTEWAVDAVELLGGLLVFYQLMIATAVMIVGLIADGVVDRVNARRYHLQKTGFGTLSGSIWTSLRSNLVFILLFILFLPLVFVPIVNIVVQLWLWMLLIRKPLYYDSLAMYASRAEYTGLMHSERGRNFMLTLGAASLFLIPLVGVFIYVLQLLLFTNFNLARLVRLRQAAG